MAPPAVPSGQSPPVEVINPTHHGAWIVIATALGLVLGFACIFIRSYVRIVITPPFARDDYIHVASMVRRMVKIVEMSGRLMFNRVSP